MGIQVYEKKQQQQLKHLLVVKKFFHPKSKPRKKLVHQKAWDSHRMTRIKKIDPKKPIPPPPKKYKNPVFTAMYPLMIQFFLTRTTKKYQQKKRKSLFLFFFFLKKKKKKKKKK